MRIFAAIVASMTLLGAGPGLAVDGPPGFVTDVVPPPPAHGSLQALTRCGPSIWYTAASRDRPALLAPLFDGPGNALAVRLCTDFDGNSHYFLRDLWRGTHPAGMCYVQEKEIFPGTPTYPATAWQLDDAGQTVSFTLTGWGWEPPARWRSKGYPVERPMNWPTDFAGRLIFAQVKDNECPPGNDPAYFAVGNVPPGLLKQIVAFYRKVTASDDSLAAALAAARYTPRAGEIAFVRRAPVTGVDCSMEACRVWIAGAWLVGVGILDGKLALTGIGRPPV